MLVRVSSSHYTCFTSHASTCDAPEVTLDGAEGVGMLFARQAAPGDRPFVSRMTPAWLVKGAGSMSLDDAPIRCGRVTSTLSHPHSHSPLPPPTHDRRVGRGWRARCRRRCGQGRVRQGDPPLSLVATCKTFDIVSTQIPTVEEAFAMMGPGLGDAERENKASRRLLSASPPSSCSPRSSPPLPPPPTPHQVFDEIELYLSAGRPLVALLERLYTELKLEDLRQV